MAKKAKTIPVSALKDELKDRKREYKDMLKGDLGPSEISEYTGRLEEIEDLIDWVDGYED